MSEPADPNAVLDIEQEYTNDDKTQPTADILNVLNQLNSSGNQLTVKTEPLDNVLPPVVPPPSEYEALTAQLKEKPHNPEGWRRLVELAEQSGEIEKIRATYDALLVQYPNTVCDPCPIPPGACLMSFLSISLVFCSNCIHKSLLERPEYFRRGRRIIQEISSLVPRRRSMEILPYLRPVRLTS